MNQNLKENDRLFWKWMNRCRREVCVRSDSVLDKFGRMLITKDEVIERWREYFKELFGDDGEKDVSIGTVGTEVRREKNRYMGEKNITMEEEEQ